MGGNILKIAIALLALLLLKSCLFPARTYQSLKITAEVETPQGLRSGSSVIGFATVSVPAWLPGSTGAATQVQGESPVVDLGGGRRLFVLLSDAHFGHAVGDLRDARRRNADNTVKTGHYPVLVTFTDPAVAASVVEVPPANLGSIFGPGYSLRSIVAEPVDQAATFGDLAKIPLFKDIILKAPFERYIAGQPDGGTAPQNDAQLLTRSSFQQSAPR